MMGNSPDKNDRYMLYGGTGRGTRTGYYGGDGHTEGQGGYGGCHGRNSRHAGRGQGPGIGSTTVNRRNYSGNDEENMVTPEKNGGIKWGHGFDNAEWQKAGNEVTEISKKSLGETGNEDYVKENTGSGVNNAAVNVTKPTAVEIFRKLNRLPVGSMIGMHQIDQLEVQEKDQVLLSLVVSKGAKKFSKSMEMLEKKWLWYSREILVEMFNNETDMGEAIFKAT